MKIKGKKMYRNTGDSGDVKSPVEPVKQVESEVWCCVSLPSVAMTLLVSRACFRR